MHSHLGGVDRPAKMAYLMRVACEDWSRNGQHAAKYTRAENRWLTAAGADQTESLAAENDFMFGSGSGMGAEAGGEVSDCCMYREQALECLRNGLEAAEGGASSAASAETMNDLLSRGVNFLDVRRHYEDGVHGNVHRSSRTVEFTISSPRGDTTFFSFTFSRIGSEMSDVVEQWTYEARPVPTSDAGIRRLLPTTNDYIDLASQKPSANMLLVALDTFSTQNVKPEAANRRDNIRRELEEEKMDILKAEVEASYYGGRPAPPPPLERLGTFIKSIGLDAAHITKDDVLLSLVLLVCGDNWNKPPTPDRDGHVRLYYDETELPLWLFPDRQGQVAGAPSRISWHDAK